MTRQERTAARQKDADAQFEAILLKSKELVKANQDKRDKAWKRPETMTKAAFKVACAVRVLRDSGVAWWAIAQSLGLPGAGDSATTGKSGASKARRLYSEAFGSLPEVRATSKNAATTVARVAGAFFNADMKDEEIEAAVIGRKVVWQIRMDKDIVKEDEAICSPTRAVVIPTPRGRAIRFNTVVRETDMEYYRGPERTVLVHQIMQVTGLMHPAAQVI